MLYLLLVLIIGAAVYIGWRAIRAQSNQARTRVVGPDDDPDFLWRLSHGDNNPR